MIGGVRFVGRRSELAKLEDGYRGNLSQFIVIYGRRRVGKSTLLKRFCEGKRHLYLTGHKGEKKKETFTRLAKHLSACFDNALLAKVRIDNWEDAFSLLDAEIKDEKLIVVLDEFQWLCSRNANPISALQECWDTKWKDNRKIYIVLCGSIISFMEKEVLSEKSPLFGRRTGSMELGSMSAPVAKSFFPQKSPIEQGQTIMTFGGIPSYLERVDPKKSLAQIINDTALTKDGFFVNEVEFVLREQLKNPKRYYIMLDKMSSRPMSRVELAKALRISNSGALDLHLKTLTDIRLIRQIVPIDRTAKTSKFHKYAIWDEFLRFYFTFIQPNKELIAMNTDDWLYDRIVAPKWESYCGYSFELFCVKNIEAIMTLLGIKDTFKRSGTYWRPGTKSQKGVQIDMIIERSDKTTHLIECKWSNGKIGKNIVDEILRKKELFPNPDKHTLKTVLITTHGATDDALRTGIDDVLTLEDIMNLSNDARA